MIRLLSHYWLYRQHVKSGAATFQWLEAMLYNFNFLFIYWQKFTIAIVSIYLLAINVSLDRWELHFWRVSLGTRMNNFPWSAVFNRNKMLQSIFFFLFSWQKHRRTVGWESYKAWGTWLPKIIPDSDFYSIMFCSYVKCFLNVCYVSN